MKTWLKGYKWVGGLVLCAAAVAAGILLFNRFYEPKRCALDGDGMKYHAPVIVDLATGELAEMEVYEPHPYLVGEIAGTQVTGNTALSMPAGIMMYSNTGIDCRATLPEKRDRMRKSLYCRKCRKLLSDVATQGYVLLDMYDPDDIKAYEIAPGAEYAIRDYAVSIHRDADSGQLTILAAGRYER